MKSLFLTVPTHPVNLKESIEYLQMPVFKKGFYVIDYSNKYESSFQIYESNGKSPLQDTIKGILFYSQNFQECVKFLVNLWTKIGRSKNLILQATSPGWEYEEY